jgi:putative oxidoreductase
MASSWMYEFTNYVTRRSKETLSFATVTRRHGVTVFLYCLFSKNKSGPPCPRAPCLPTEAQRRWGKKLRAFPAPCVSFDRLSLQTMKLLSPKTLWYNEGLVFIRVLVGILMAYHGLEIFDRSIMEGYLQWDVIKVLPAPELATYVGKTMELITGVCFILGIFTRIAALIMAADMLFICFYVGSGKFYYQDQHPFLFALIALVFFFTGPVKWSLDQLFFGNSSR